MKTTFIFVMLLSMTNSWALVPDSANSEPDVMGPKTLGQPSYPSSGPLPKRRPDMTGEGTSSSTFSSSDINPTVPSRKPEPRGPVGKEAQEEGPKKIREEFPIGPYQDGVIQYKVQEP